MSLRYTSDVEITELEEVPLSLSGREALVIVQDGKTFKTSIGGLISSLGVATLPLRPSWDLVTERPVFTGVTTGAFTANSSGEMLYNGEVTSLGVAIPEGQVQHFVDLTVSDAVSAEVTLPAGDFSGVVVGVRASFPTVQGWTVLTTTPDGFVAPDDWTLLPSTPPPTGFVAPAPGGIVTTGFVDYHNPATKHVWSANSGGWTAPDGWVVGNPAGQYVYTMAIVTFYNPSTRQLWNANQGGWLPPDGWYQDDFSEGSEPWSSIAGTATLNIRNGSPSGVIIDTLDGDPEQDSVDAAWYFNNGTDWKTFPSPPDALTL
jgi:hypothetical protein